MLALLRKHGIRTGTAVDLGCGAGTWADLLAGAGFQVAGWDLSRAMIARARARVPRGDFTVGSFLDADLPPCELVTALGEVLSYALDARVRLPALRRFFARVHAALRPGGLLVLDVVTPGRGTPARTRVVEGVGWLVISRVSETREMLTREITTFMRAGKTWRRTDELHRQRLFHPREIAAGLRAAGFAVHRVRALGSVAFGPGQAAWVARRRP